MLSSHSWPWSVHRERQRVDLAAGGRSAMKSCHARAPGAPGVETGGSDERVRRSVSRVLCPRASRSGAMAIHLGRPSPDASRDQPGRRSGNGPERLAALAPPLFGLAPGGVCRAGPVAGTAVRSYRTLSPLPRPAGPVPGRSALCGTFPGVAPAGRYPAPCFRGARTFLRRRARRRRPSDRLTRPHR